MHTATTATAQNDLSPFIDTAWQPIAMSTSASLSKEIVSDDFQSAMQAMLEEFDTLLPTEHYADGSSKIALSARRELMEKHFPFGTFHIVNQFIDLQDDTPTCVATLHVLTDEGYEPWFSRMGTGLASDVSTDGLLADAETSALRRLMTALGLGNESNEEAADTDRLNRITLIQNHLDATSQGLLQLIDAYKDHSSRFDLPALAGHYPNAKSSKQEREAFDFNLVSDSDATFLIAYINKTNAGKG